MTRRHSFRIIEFIRARTSTIRTFAALVAGALLVAPTVDAATPPQKKGATYTGRTSQGNNCAAAGKTGQPCKIVAKVSKDGKTVTGKILFSAPCTDGKFLSRSTTFTKVPISSKGKFSLSGTYTSSFGQGDNAENSVALRGQFIRKDKKYSLKGSYSHEATVTYADGTTTYCETGKVTFTARPR